MNIIKRLQAEAVSFGGEPLLVSPGGQAISLSRGYIPLLTNFTFEDKAAKGLRKRSADDKPQPAVYFSALELVRDHNVLLLSGPSGSGKTTFARYLASSLATRAFTAPNPLVRNETGEFHDEKWDGVDLSPCYLIIHGPNSLKAFMDNTLPELIESLGKHTQAKNAGLMLILDKIDKAGAEGPGLVAELLTRIKGLNNIRLLLLGDTRSVKHWILPSNVVRHDLLPLLGIQRRQAVSSYTGISPSRVTIGLGAAAATPAYFALALEAEQHGDIIEELLDEWLAAVAPENDASDRIASQAFERLTDRALQPDGPRLCHSHAIQQLLVARHLFILPLQTATSLFHSNPFESEPILRSLLARLDAVGKTAGLVEELIRGSGTDAQLGALLVSNFITESSVHRDQVSNLMLAVVVKGSMSGVLRDKAGRVLSRLGDPRDLAALAVIPPGNVTLGSNCHPNSQPTAEVPVPSFRIGIYPVINQDYSVFIRETGREWQSPDGFAPERQNAPATDLSWYDARAYCAWMTIRWQSTGRIGADEHVRLPTEPEWERASRGNSTMIDSPIYSWGTNWQHDTANYEETGLNTTCSVGLFPRGRSPYGCYDMAGNIWEWCTTLWGEDMGTPSFRYPWRNDGREVLDASGSIRRVLRGGCFSSGRLKICCTYRGSLEPAGFWRGNGFRIVVAPIGSNV